MDTSTSTNQKSSEGLRVGVQKFGRLLSGMVMPNIGAFIAWGLITAMFIPTGWIPNEYLAKLVGPTITYLLPLLIGYTGGKMIHGQRGAVIGAIATIGVIIGSDIPMFLGAMISGPIAAWILKQFDRAIEGKIKAGFEMLVNNYSIGIIGGAIMLGTYSVIGPAVEALTNVLAHGVDFLIKAHLLPLVNLIIEPAKVLFLNNAINHGILSPLAAEEVSKHGKSILFMLEANPGPGVGILLAYWLVGKGTAKQSAPGAIIIQFFGGIHEIYFPYILMNPRLVLAAMAGGVSGTFIFQAFGVGLHGPASPGSIIAFLSVTPKGDFLGVILGIVIAAAVSFLIASLLLKATKNTGDDESIEEATAKMKDMKSAGMTNTAAEVTGAGEAVSEAINQLSPEDVHKIVFACDAGMGSSAMGASVLRKKMQQAGVDVTVVNAAISEIPNDADIVITQKTLTDRAKTKLPTAEHISIENFLKSPEYDKLVDRLKN